MNNSDTFDNSKYFFDFFKMAFAVKIDFVQDPVPTIQKINEFMGTQRSPELIQQVADVTSFSKMKEGKHAAFDESKSTIGDNINVSSQEIL